MYIIIIIICLNYFICHYIIVITDNIGGMLVAEQSVKWAMFDIQVQVLIRAGTLTR